MNQNEKENAERQIEEFKLEQTISIVSEEIINYLNKRKDIADYILDYRKKALEEFKDDEDKIIEYFDHERFVKEEAYKSLDRRLKELTILKETPYFGRVSFYDKEYDDEESIYIGRFGLTPEGSYEPVIVDWRAPVASLFYKGMFGDSSYKSLEGVVPVEIKGRRQYVIKKAKLLGMFDSEIDIKDEILQLVLSSNSGDKLKDIVTTLQREQDDIIRQEREKTVVVNGVAGSGKTTVALHRVAYLLYNYRNILNDKVLIIGPNEIFTEYISTVLPSLGEGGVRQTTFSKFASELLGLDEVMDFKEYSEKLLSGDQQFISEVIHKKSPQYLSYLEDYIKKLDLEYFKIKPVLLEGKEVVSKQEIEELFHKHYAYMPLFRRSEKVKRILVSKLKDRRDELVRRLNQEIKMLKASLTPEKLKAEENNIDFARRIRIREIIRNLMNAREDIDRWITPASVIELYTAINHNKPIIREDLAPMLYLKLKLTGVKSKEQIKHVVIDEAQDFSALELKLIKEVTGAISMTVVGDANQRLIDTKEAPAMLSMKEILPELQVKEFALNNSYRSTQEIMEYANSYLEEKKIVPLVRRGDPVQKLLVESPEEASAAIIEAMNAFKEKGYENIAVITRSIEELEEIEPYIKAKRFIASIKEETVVYQGGAILIPSYFAKGLEFDAAIVIDNKQSQTHSLVKYIMCTRALHQLMEINY